MPHENVTITGELKDRVRNILGGERPTPTRLKRVLDELEQYRALYGTLQPEPPKVEQPRDPDEDDDDTPTPPDRAPQPAPESAPLSEELRRAYEDASRDGDPDEGPDDDVEFEDLEDIADKGEPARLPEPQDPRDAALHALMKQVSELTQEVKALRKPATAAEIADARSEGRLPPLMPAPPLGGPTTWPIGEWFTSSIGPKVWRKICPCCAKGAWHHWYCVICKSGPHHYATPCKEHHDAQRHPFYTKNHFPPGQVWGEGHACCSKPCMDDYLARMGVVAGVNEAEPIQGMPGAGEARGEPQRPVTALTSD